MREIGHRRRAQPAPPHVVFEALTDFDRAGSRRWLDLLDDEQRPTVTHRHAPSTVVWSSIWIKRPDASVDFGLASDGSYGTDLTWSLFVDDPPPDDALIGHMRKRVNELINAELRFSFGQ